MVQKMENVYIFFDDCTKVDNDKVSISDIATVYCSNKNLKNKINALKVYTFPNPSKQKKDNSDSDNGRIIITALKIFEIILSEYPDVNIIPTGSTDIIIEKNSKQPSLSYVRLKTAFICLIVFFGSAFTIMAFNNDVQVHDVFAQIYELFAGEEHEGFTVLECSYSIGLGAGILIFYNHFGKRKLSKDPTPLEIEMRLYENDINTTLIDGIKRSNKHIDVN